MQKIVYSRRSYPLTVIGLTIWFMGEIENLMDEMYNIDYGIGFDLKSMTSIEIIIAGGESYSMQDYFCNHKRILNDSKRKPSYMRIFRDMILLMSFKFLQVVWRVLYSMKKLLPQNALTLIKSAEVASKRMVRLVQALATTQQPASVRSVTMVEQVAADVEKSLRGLKVYAKSDAEMLRTYGSASLPAAIENLLGNSYEHASPKESVTITIGGTNDNALIIISDNGGGISPEKQSTLFSRGMTGTSRGMGLYLIRTVLRSCGREISDIPHPDGAKSRINIPIMW